MRPTRLSKLWLKALRTDSNTIADAPLNFTKLTGQTANFIEVRDTDDTTVLAKINASGVVSSAAGTSAGNVVTLDGTQTLTNKTLTSPTLTTPGVAVINDTGGINRAVLNATAKTISDGAATSLFDVACAAGAMVGGAIFYQVEASDGTDHQALTGMVTYAAVNKGGTHTLTITEVAGNQAKAVSAGTLTLSWTFVTGTNKGTVKLQPTGSLTETTYRVTYTVLPLIGAVTIV
jgi:hypothetical protein